MKRLLCSSYLVFSVLEFLSPTQTWSLRGWRCGVFLLLTVAVHLNILWILPVAPNEHAGIPLPIGILCKTNMLLHIYNNQPGHLPAWSSFLFLFSSSFDAFTQISQDAWAPLHRKNRSTHGSLWYLSCKTFINVLRLSRLATVAGAGTGTGIVVVTGAAAVVVSVASESWNILAWLTDRNLRVL